MFTKSALTIIAACTVVTVMQTHTAYARDGGGRERAAPIISIGGQPIRKPEEPAEPTRDPNFGKFLDELARGDRHLQLTGDDYQNRANEGR